MRFTDWLLGRSRVRSPRIKPARSTRGDSNTNQTRNDTESSATRIHARFSWVKNELVQRRKVQWISELIQKQHQVHLGGGRYGGQNLPGEEARRCRIPVRLQPDNVRQLRRWVIASVCFFVKVRHRVLFRVVVVLIFFLRPATKLHPFHLFFWGGFWLRDSFALMCKISCMNYGLLSSAPWDWSPSLMTDSPCIAKSAKLGSWRCVPLMCVSAL